MKNNGKQKQKHKHKHKHKRHFKLFRLTILNENTLDVLFTMRLTKTKMWIYVFSLLAVVCLLFYIVLFATPVRHVLPGYLDPKLKQQMLTDAFRLDALSEEVSRQDAYISLLKLLVSGEYEMDTTNFNLDSLAGQQALVLKETSEVEKKYRQEYEEREKYSLTTFDPHISTDGLLFYMPVNGKVIRHYSQNEDHFGLDLSTTSRQAVMSVLDGHIIMAAYTPDFDYVVMVQHNNDFVSVYRELTEVLKSEGDEVKAGEAMAFIASNSGNNNPHLHFELWYKGHPLNPEEYILFK